MVINMVRVLLRHSVEDYDTWKSHFDEHESTRKEHGEEGYQLLRETDDPNDLVMLFNWDSTENARGFLDSSDLRDTMAEAGVVGEPEISFLDEIESQSFETPMA